MPTYTYKCSKCEYEKDRILKISEYDIPCNEPCPECGSEKSIFRKVNIPHHGDPVRMGLVKPNSGFKDVLQRIHERTPGSNLMTSSTITKL